MATTTLEQVSPLPTRPSQFELSSESFGHLAKDLFVKIVKRRTSPDEYLIVCVQQLGEQRTYVLSHGHWVTLPSGLQIRAHKTLLSVIELRAASPAQA